MHRAIALTILMMLSGCSLPELKKTDLVDNMQHLHIEAQQIQSATYCTMGFIDPEIKRYRHYDEKEKRFKSYDMYKLKKCVLVNTGDQLVVLPRKGSKIKTPEIISINKNDLEGIGLYVTGKYRQIQLKTQGKTIVLELLKTTGMPDGQAASDLYQRLGETGAAVFSIEELALPVPPVVGTFHW